MIKKWLTALVCVMMSNWGVAHEQDLLKSSDISRIMQQILSEHVDKKEVTPPVLQHAFETYINQFDPHRMYLLESEVVSYFKPYPAQLAQAIQQYKRNDFSQFKQLNQTIQASIERARRIREDLEASVKASTFHPSPDKEHTPIANKEGFEPFAATREQLKERMMQNL